MLPPPTTLRLIRFGTFQVDLKAREVRKDGVKVRLQEQPFQILAMLLEHAGDIVTREELRHRLWPEDTFVDFDQGLNKAVNKIREALGDSYHNPRFIETLPKRGYRFVAPVKGRNSPPGPGPIATQDTAWENAGPDSRAGVEDCRIQRRAFGFVVTSVVASLLKFLRFATHSPHKMSEHSAK